jgi:hypothetical protein
MEPVDPKSAMYCMGEENTMPLQKSTALAAHLNGGRANTKSASDGLFYTNHVTALRRASLSLIISVFALSTVRGQTSLAPDTNRMKPTSDSSLSNTPRDPSRYWHRPQAERNGPELYFGSEAMRYYGSPTTLSNLFEESGGPFPLVLGEEAYGRESFLVTSRTSEGFASTFIDGVLPINSMLTGNTMTNYFPIEAFDAIAFNSGAGGLSTTGGDYAGSDVANATIERFRAPVPYSRVHFNQDLARGTSNFDGIFSLNASRATNVAFGLHRHSSGHAPAQFDATFNPRADVWSARGQMSVSKYLGTLPIDSTVTQRKIDSILAAPESKKKTLDLLLWAQYTTAFSGLNGGINARDSIDIFNPQIAPVFDLNTFDHRIRGDVLVEAELPLLADARTKLAGHASYESRRILSPDATFPSFVPDVSVATRAGVTLDQPLTLSIGDFITRADIRGDIERLHKDSVFTFASPVTDTRLSATFSDSLALRTAFRIALFGFVRTVQSNLSIGGDPSSFAVLPSLGFSGSIGFTDNLSFSASYHYARDRAALSPNPDKTYQLRNIGGWIDLRVPLSKNDSLAIHAGVLDRNEPEGIVYDLASDSVHPHPFFSNAELHSQSANVAVDAYFSHIHFAGSATYFPAATPISPYTRIPLLSSDLSQKFFGFAGLYFENEAAEGNLRITIGPRFRFYNGLNTQLTYDPASDYYVYRGYAPSIPDSVIRPLGDARISTPKYLVDFILSMEIDRRAQLSTEFLNILGAPYYNVSLYPRSGFHWRLDVTWAFLD